ncbi:MAG: hypothetical protein GC191_14025 [Azospirillum sp.]|nr:hypothetical protein [Azospirillum sp.]
MAAKDDAGPDAEREDAEAEGTADPAHDELMKRLSVEGDALINPQFPFGGALIRIDRDLFEPSRLTISTFAVKPYDGQLIAGQMFQGAILLPSADEPFEFAVAGAIKTVDDQFGLRALFQSPQPHAQARFAQHLMAVRRLEEKSVRPPPPPPSKKRRRA